MKPAFRDPQLQTQYERNGFVVARLFSDEQVTLLLKLYGRYIRREEVSGLYESSRNKSYETNRIINEAIQEEVTLAGRDLFLQSKIFGGTFMVKSHADSDVLPLHQDWSVVEEDRYTTVFVWCPLVDVAAVNGCLFVLPGSHRFFRTLRSGTYPSDRFVLPPEVHKHTQDVPLRAGQAVCYSDALFHGSHANNGVHDRIVVTARIMEEDGGLVYFHKANDREVDVYAADEEFYLTHIDVLAKGGMPSGVRKLYRRPYRHNAVTDQSLQATIRKHFPATGGATGMNQLFRDEQLQSQFDREGYIVIDLLDQAQVAGLTAFYGSLTNAATPAFGFQVSLDNESPEFVRTVSERLVNTVRPSVDRHFQDHKIFTASFVTKAKNPLGVVPPHQDWTFVDEDRFWSATIWCPLIDVDMDNGALGVIKGSHWFYEHVRPSPSPQYTPPFKDQLFSIFPYLTIVKLQAGQAIVFNNKTLHASPPNTTDRTRPAFGIGITHQDAGIRHYYMLPGQEKPVMEGYEVGPDFFFSYNNARLSALYEKGMKPQGLNSLGVFAVSARHYETTELVDRIKAAGNEEDSLLVRKMAALFDYNLDGTLKNRREERQADSTGPDTAPPFWRVYTPINIYREIRYRLAARR
jgi:ectoine hydroxylase-related dioxygenase (phytanoyl-CoA dioxygenase family)